MVWRDEPVPTRLKLAGLWASTVFCYIYGDYFGLYVPGTVLEMNRGEMGPLGHAGSGLLVGVALMMALPSAMVALSLLLPVVLCRWGCIVLGLFYTAIMGVSLPGSASFYQVMGAIEMVLTLAVAVVAFRWPRGAVR